MPGFLKQSTASQSRALGPFVDDTDFKTAETGLTIANTDIKLIVNGGASANKNSGGGTHRANGVYGVTFDATDTATVGEMQVSVVVAGALPVFDKFFVLEEAVYDELFGASAVGYIANAPVSVAQWNGSNVATPDTAGYPKVTIKSGTGTGEISLSSGVAQADAAKIGGQTASASGTVTFPNATLASTTNITAGTITTVTNLTNAPTNGDLTATMKASVNAEVDSALDTAIPGTPTSNSINERIATMDNAYTATRAGYLDNINNSALQTTVAQTGDSYAIVNNGTYGNAQLGAGIDAIYGAVITLAPPTAAQVADAVWDEAQSGHTTNGTFGKYLDSAISGVSTGGVTAADIADAVWDEARSGHTTSGTFGQGVASVQGNLTGSVGSLATQAKADVNAEVVDTLATDTYAEPGQGAPTATTSLAAKIGWLYKAFRNKKTQTESQFSLYNDDASTVDSKATVSDDGTTTTIGELASGP